MGSPFRWESKPQEKRHTTEPIIPYRQLAVFFRSLYSSRLPSGTKIDFFMRSKASRLCPVIQTLDSAINRKNRYPEDKYYQLRYPLDGGLSSRSRVISSSNNWALICFGSPENDIPVIIQVFHTEAQGVLEILRTTPEHLGHHQLTLITLDDHHPLQTLVSSEGLIKWNTNFQAANSPNKVERVLVTSNPNSSEANWKQRCEF